MTASLKLDVAWDEVELVLASSTVDPMGLRTLMAVRIMAAVRDGERDPERLKELGDPPVSPPSVELQSFGPVDRIFGR